MPPIGCAGIVTRRGSEGKQWHDRRAAPRWRVRLQCGRASEGKQSDNGRAAPRWRIGLQCEGQQREESPGARRPSLKMLVLAVQYVADGCFDACFIEELALAASFSPPVGADGRGRPARLGAGDPSTCA